MKLAAIDHNLTTLVLLANITSKARPKEANDA
jgi:hypothetical protein